MALPENIDFDKIAYHALNDAGYAMREWIKGAPRSEEAFMNQLTGRLARNRRGCDVGVLQRVDMDATSYMLHRADDDNSDKYGADLAVTVIVDTSFVKTAFFQLKKCSGYEVRLKKDQIDDASIDPRIEDRSFALAVDEARQGYRLRKIDELDSEFGNQKTKGFDASDWNCLIRWIRKWLECDLGPESDTGDPNSVEALLEEFVVEDDLDGAWGSGGDEIIPPDYPDNAIPALNWLILTFAKSESK